MLKISVLYPKAAAFLVVDFPLEVDSLSLPPLFVVFSSLDRSDVVLDFKSVSKIS